jgi:hypothetical protein
MKQVDSIDMDDMNDDDYDGPLVAKDVLLLVPNIVHRVLFMIVLTFIVVFVVIFIVHDVAWSQLRDAQVHELKKLGWIYTACTVSYFLLQGSDPGYLSTHANDDDIENAAEMLDKSTTGDSQEEERGSDNDEMHGATQVREPLHRTTRLVQPTRNQIASRRKSVMTAMQSAMGMDDAENPTTEEEFCQYCHIIKPIRTHHCRQCNRCVSKFDHHCHFMHTCIGEKNHCRFVCFLGVHAYALFYGWWICMYSIVYSVFAGFLFLILSCLLLFVVCLLGFHAWLIVSSMTSIECGRGSRISYLRDIGEFDLPFSKCLCVDIYDFCCMRDALMIWIWRVVFNLWSAVRYFVQKAVSYVMPGREFSTDHKPSTFVNEHNSACDNDHSLREKDRKGDSDSDSDSSDMTTLRAASSVYAWWDCSWHSITTLNWKPRKWPRPGPIIRDSDDICAHPWQNKYYSCC